MEILYLATSVLSLFFILILAGKKNKSDSDIILILWFVLLFSNVFSFYLVIKTLAPSWLVVFLDHSVFLHGPLLFLYASALTGIPKKASMKSALHFLPFLLLLPLSAWLAFIEWEYLDNYTEGLIIFKFTVPFVYILISLRIIARHRHRIANIFSSINQMELRWLSLVLYGLLGLDLFGACTMIIHFLTPVNIPQSGGQYLNIAYSAFIIVLGYFGFRQTTIFIPTHLQEDQFVFEQSSKNGSADKYQKAKLREAYVEKTYQELLQHMSSHKPYTDNNLTLIKLAEQLGVSENKLSQVINTQSKDNFFEFVNKYRVEMVIEKMKRGEHKSSTLLGLAFDSGFNSKASFNRTFKRITGVTPSEYLKTRQTSRK